MAEPVFSTRPEVGLSHVALVVADLDASIAFYARYAAMETVHRRGEAGHQVAWLSDGSRPFVLVLIEREQVEVRLQGAAHLGVGCPSRGEVDRLAALARQKRCLIEEPKDVGPPVGYTALLRDPDGHNLELSYGQEISLSVAKALQQLLRAS